MIRVLIAEDEPPTMRRLKRLIEQTDPSFVVVDTASDGERALESMREAPCDVVFTDIRMPVMDGLGLMDALQAEFPACQVVVVSGYQDFEYVSHALRAKITDYILKPVSQEDMEALLLRIKAVHQQRSRERLSSLLSTHINRPAVRMPSEGEEDNVPLGVCLFCAGPFPMDFDAEMFSAASVWQTLSLEQVMQAAFPAFDGFVWEFMGNTSVERIFIYETREAPADAIAEALYVEVVARTQIPITCCCIQEGIVLSETGKMLHRLRRSVRGAVRIGQSQFAVLDAEPLATEDTELYGKADAERLARCIREGIGESAFWHELYARMQGEAWTQRQIWSVLQSAIRHLEQDGKITEKAAQYREICAETLCTALSMAEFRAALEAITPLSSAKEPDEEHIAAKIAAYLRAHFAEHINNQTLAQRFGYVPSYLSLLFRNAYGISPSEYLTQIRLEEAKRLMLSQPNMLIRDIAETVGFKSQHHFSRVFKKNEGMWPSSYQA